MRIVRIGIVTIAANSKAGKATPMTMSESAVRSLAKRRGYILRKSRRRDPNAIDFDGYMPSATGT
jgi:hypothetical protein